MALAWSFVSKITNSKRQINPPAIARHERAGLKFQYSMTKTFNDKTSFGFSNFGYWNLFDNWDLIFGISISQ